MFLCWGGGRGLGLPASQPPPSLDPKTFTKFFFDFPRKQRFHLILLVFWFSIEKQNFCPGVQKNKGWVKWWFSAKTGRAWAWACRPAGPPPDPKTFKTIALFGFSKENKDFYWTLFDSIGLFGFSKETKKIYWIVFDPIWLFWFCKDKQSFFLGV